MNIEEPKEIDIREAELGRSIEEAESDIERVKS